MSKPIKVSWDNVEIAFERNSPELHSHIDRESGEVLVVVDGVAEDAEQRRLIASDPERYVRIDPASSREQYRWMERFVTSVEDQQLRERLLIAIDGKGAFRRFKDVLLSYPAERERWFNYRANLLHHHINQWFAAKGLTPDPPCPWGEVELPPEPEDAGDRALVSGQSPADILRLQVKTLVDALPACELHSARVFLEYLRDRGTAELTRAATTPAAEPAPPAEASASPGEPEAAEPRGERKRPSGEEQPETAPLPTVS
jgi:hypothetical protein